MKNITIRKFRAVIGSRKYYQGNGNTCFQGMTREVLFLNGNNTIGRRMVSVGGSLPLAEKELLELGVGEEVPRHLCHICLDNQGRLRFWVGGSSILI